MKTPPQPKEFWIVNATSRDVGLGDLYVTIKAYASVNLLDKRHYYLTWDQIYKSLTSGSMHKKRNSIAVRKIPPKVSKKVTPLRYDDPLPSRTKSVYEITEEKFEELELSDEEFVNQTLE